MSQTKTQSGTIGSGGTATAAGSIAGSLTKSLSGLGAFSPNSQIAPPAAAHTTAAAVAAQPSRVQRAIGNSITKGTQR